MNTEVFMKGFKKIISIIMIAAVIASVIVVSTVSSGATATGVGLASWAMRAYNEGWSYVWGGASVGAVDCSGLIYSYCGGNRTSMLSDAQANGRAWGYVSNGIPRVHGLGLSRPGHVGVYVGNGMEVDARGSGYGVCYQAVGSSWSCWFKLTAVSYPTTGWQKFNGNSYYYENGEYIVNTTRTIDGVTYSFSSSGAATSLGSSSSSDSSSSSSSSSAVEDNGPLKKGSQGDKVIKLQTRLKELGYYNGTVDGDFGEKTETAFKLFQKQAGLYVDGVAGSDTDYLYSDSAARYVPEVKATEAPAVTATEAPAQTTTTTTTTSSASSNKKQDLASTGAQEDIAESAAEPTEAEKAAEEISFGVGDTDDKIITIQERLIALGYLDGIADGSYGTLTENAVKEFQSYNKLEKSGKIDQKTYDLLFSNVAVKSPVQFATEPALQIKADEELPATSPITKTTAPSDTAVEKANTQISSKAVASVTDNIGTSTRVNANLEFILWLAIMIVVLLIAFTIVYAVQKKKNKAMAYSGRHYM